MPAFRRISSHHHSAHASRHLGDMCDATHGNPYYTPHDSIKSEPIDVSIPCTISSSPSASSEPCISPCITYPQTKDSVVPIRLPASPSPDTPSPSKTSTIKTNNIHGRRREPGYVPRPCNAFIVFRSDYIERHRHLGEDQQNELSKQAGRAWNKLSEDSEEKQRFRAIAAREQEAHKIAHPGYQYGPRGVSRGVSSPKARKATTRARRAVEEDRRSPSWSPSQSAATYSPKIVSSRPRAVRAPRAAARVAAERLEQLASAPSLQESPPSPAASEPMCPATDTAMPESSLTVVNDAFVPTQSIPVFALEDDAAAHQVFGMKEQAQDEPVFTLDLPPTLRYDSEYEQFGLGIQSGFDAYSTCVPAPSTLPSVVPFPAVMAGIPTSKNTMLYDWSASPHLSTPELDLGYSPLSLSEELGAMRNSGYEQYQLDTDAAQSAYDLDFWIQPEILSFSEGMDA